MTFELDKQQQTSEQNNSTQASTDSATKKQKLMSQLVEAEKVVEKTQGLVWLAQALTELDQEITQSTLDKVQAIISLAQNQTAQIEEETKEFNRLLLDTSQTFAAGQTQVGAENSQRTTVDERDSFLKGLHKIIELYDCFSQHPSNQR